jgi:benzoyl-CoA reductase/2-hydroxyglutaryl-CoA dehydratase subunit BcrC/BadD/HgdB
MDWIKTYSNIIKKNLDKPDRTSKLIKLGLDVAYRYVTLFPDRKLPKSLQYLNKICLKNIKEPLSSPQNSAWVNIFAPTEFLHAMDIYPLFIEAYSSFMSGFLIEDALIDKAESAGISNTLCSFHKAFLGSGELNILKKPKMAITTSMVCDANINTFRYLSEKYDIPLYIIDIPYEYNRDSLEYVKKQLKEMAVLVEEVFDRKLDIDKLREIVIRENQTKALINEYIENLRQRCLNSTMTFELYMLFTSHVFLGREDTLKFYKMLTADIKSAPLRSGGGIFFIHLPPLFEESFKECFNFGKEFHILGCDLNYDFLDEVEYGDPFEGIAKKMILNVYNGSIERKIEALSNIIDRIEPDGIIQFCHWGCKQSIGGAGLLKDYFKRRNIPFLAVDGDVIDKRNNQHGQAKTRLEAFLEIIKRR